MDLDKKWGGLTSWQLVLLVGRRVEIHESGLAVLGLVLYAGWCRQEALINLQ